MTRSIRKAWLKTQIVLALLLTLAVVAGLALGQPWMVLALMTLAILAWHYWRLYRIMLRLGKRQRLPQPVRPGIWNEFERQLARSQSEMRSRNKRLLDMLRTYRAAAAALPDAVVVLDRENARIEWFNEAAERLLGLSWPRDLGTAMAPYLRGISEPDWLQQASPEILLDEPSPLGPDIRLGLRLIPYADEYWLLLARDISKLMRLEAVRRDFIANVSHELRTPLTVLHGYLDMLEPEDAPEWAHVFAEMRRQSERMSQLVSDLLTLSRLDAQERAEDETVPMQALLATLETEARALSQGRHTVRVRDMAGVDLWGSPKELHSAFSNLISNAARYTPAGGRIEILFETTAQGDAALRVEDSGYGIPAQHLPRLTERFYRVSTSRSRESGGTGLGLAIVKHVLGLHDARLEIESEVGRGSRFSCILPAERIRQRIPAASP